MTGISPYIWIKTRDGSPTLWSDDISEPFRSTKGAFSESWAAFVRPALKRCFDRQLNSVVVGEFGLGPGTNWLLWSVAARLTGISFDYHVVEKEIEIFEEGLRKWIHIAEDVVDFVSKSLARDFNGMQSFGALDVGAVVKDLAAGTFLLPKIYHDLERAIAEMGDIKADIWFHDPFGYAVNPDGFSMTTMVLCFRLWSPTVAGFSYAANRHFRDAVEALDPQIVFKRVDTGAGSLKRQRSEFYAGEV